MANQQKPSAKLSHHVMQPSDIRECVALIANNPILGPRYGRLIENLPAVWLHMIEQELTFSAVILEGAGPAARICICGVTAVVRDEFLCEMKRPPYFWLGPEIIRRFMEGKSPLLSYEEVRAANAKGGLNGICWENCVRNGYEDHGELPRYVMSCFTEALKGYSWKELIANQPENLDRLRFLRNTGASLWDPIAGKFKPMVDEDPATIIATPHILGTTRELERNRHPWADHWVGVLFDHHPPILGLSRSEQRLLTPALAGMTDERLAVMLGVSLPTIKKMWTSVYGRVQRYLPHLLSDSATDKLLEVGRGREKRRRLLSYLREHPEELRPYLRKRLAKAVGD